MRATRRTVTATAAALGALAISGKLLDQHSRESGVSQSPSGNAPGTQPRTRISEDAYDVHRAGLIGTGDDTAAIQQAIVIAGAGGHLRFRPGIRYLVSSTLVPLPGQVWHMAGATLKVKPGTATAFSMIAPDAQAGAVSLLDPTIDGSRSALRWADGSVYGIGISLAATTAGGWADEHLIRNATITNTLGAAISVLGAPSSAVPTSGADAAIVPWSRVRIEGISTHHCRRGVMLDRCAGVKVTDVSFNRSDLDHVWQYLTRGVLINGGVGTTAGLAGPLSGHGFVDSYGVGTIWSNLSVDTATYNGFCAGGGDPTNNHTRGFRWWNLASRSSAANAFSVDLALALPSHQRSGHTAAASGLISRVRGHGAAIHGLYLGAVANLHVSESVFEGNKHAGIAGTCFGVSVTGGGIYRNMYGLNMQGARSGYRDDGTTAGEYGRYTGYGRWRISRRTRISENSESNVLIAPGTRGYVGSAIDLSGVGNPESAVAAPAGSTYLDTASGVLYVKTTTDTTSALSIKDGWKPTRR